MRKFLLAIGLLAALALPAGAAAMPDKAEKRAAKLECKAERGKSKATREAFKAMYGSFARCVRERGAEEEAENEAAHKNAAKECKAEQADPGFAADHDGKTFDEHYGTNANLKNAYGKCVSSKAKAHKDDMDAKDDEEAEEFRNAAKECAAERGDIGTERFATKYGSGKDGRNAFGKCVSAKVREPADIGGS